MSSSRKIRLVLSLVVALLLSGCYWGQSAVVASDGRSYDFYMDGHRICDKGESCSVSTRGSFGEHLFEAMVNDDVVGQTSVSRSITFSSVAWAPFTYFMSLYLYDAFPDQIEIPVESSGMENNSKGKDPWGESVWDKPLY